MEHDADDREAATAALELLPIRQAARPDDIGLPHHAPLLRQQPSLPQPPNTTNSSRKSSISDYGFGTHRVPLESNYLEVYHRDNVEAVSVKDNPIAEVIPEGIRLADGSVHEFDIIIMATGFDAGSGALTRIDIRGREGRSLKEDWGRDIRTTMGLAVHGYPNLFTTGAPLAPSAALSASSQHSIMKYIIAQRITP